MSRKWEEVTGKVRVQDDEGNELEWDVVHEFTENRTMHGSSVSKSKLKDVRSPNGSPIYCREEGEFYFAEEPRRIYRIIEEYDL